MRKALRSGIYNPDTSGLGTLPDGEGICASQEWTYSWLGDDQYFYEGRYVLDDDGASGR